MALLIVVMTVTTAATALVLSSAAMDSESSRENAARSQARALARSGSDEIWARISLDPTFLPQLFLLTGNSAGVNHPAVGEGKWAKLTAGGAETCTDLTEDCYHVDLTSRNTVTNSSGAVATVSSIRLTVTARVRCAGSEARCIKARIETRLRRKQFFDYLYFTKYSVLDPRLQVIAGAPFASEADAIAACADRYGADPTNPTETNTRPDECLAVSFQGQGAQQDVVAGPVYSFDNWISVCGNPRFNQGVFVRGTGHSGKVYRAGRDQACVGSNPDFGAVAPVTQQQGLSMPSTEVTIAQVRSIPSAYRYTTSDTAAVVFSVSGAAPNFTTNYTITGIDGGTSSGSIPSGSPAVFFFDRSGGVGGKVKVSGTTSGKISVFSTGDLIINGDLRYANGTTGNTSDITGLTSIDGAIVITKNPGFTNREIHAMMLSLDQAVRVEGWQNRDGFADAPQLTMYGAMAAKYQGIFGGFDSLSNKLVSGYRKNFLFDDRLRSGADLVPPYLVNPLETVWERLDATELPPGK